MRQSRTLAGAALVSLAAFGLYARTLSFDLVWDDPQLLKYVEQIHRRDGVRGLLLAEYNLRADDPLGYYRPVALLSLWTNALLASRFPPAHHLTNILLHAANSSLLLVLLRLLSVPSPAALLGTLVFAAHPVHTESVAFVAGRTDLWATLFALVCAVCWAADRAGGARRTVALRATGLASAALAALSKETALLLPAVLLLAGLLSERGTPGQLSAWWRGARFWVFGWAAALGAVLLLRLVVAGVGFGALTAGGTGDYVAPFSTRLELLPAVLATYLRLLLLPWPLNAYYTNAEVRLDALTVAAALALTGLLVLQARRRGGVAGALSAVWVVLFLLPVTGIFPVRSAVVAERFLYLPSVGVSLALATALGTRASFPRRWWLAGAAVLALAGVGTLVRESVWRDDLSLFESVVAASPAGSGGHYGLGLALAARGRHSEAIEAFRTTLEITPDFPEAQLSLGISCRAVGRPEEAITVYRAVLEKWPRFPQAEHNLGSTLASIGRYDEAAAHLERALELDPGLALARYTLGNVRLARGDRQRALEEHRLLAPLDPILAERLLGNIRAGFAGRD